MKRTNILIGIALSVSLVVMPFRAESGDTGAFTKWKNSQAASSARQAAELDRAWQQMRAAEQARFERLKAEVLRKWNTYQHSTNKVWVDYADDREAFARVDFEIGELTVEALVPADAPAETSKEAVAEKLAELAERKDAAGTPVLEGVLPPAAGKAVEFGKAKVEERGEVTGNDGVVRRKVGVTLSLVPDHVRHLAQRYLPKVRQEARKHNVEPALVMAVIHAESFFNPMARSHVPAFGLMQIVPRYAGQEAYEELYGEPKLPSPEYLYNPDRNIELGVTYLDLLQRKYFPDIADGDKRRMVVVCSYNWGPDSMKRRLLPRVPLERLNAKELFIRLRKGVPGETRAYLSRVEERRRLYLDEAVAVK